MDAIVPPGNTNLVVDDHHKHSHHRLAEVDILNRISNAAENIVNNENANSRYEAGMVDRMGLANVNVTERNALEARQLSRFEAIETRANIRHAEGEIAHFGLRNLDAINDGFKGLLVSMKDDLRDLIISNKNDIKDILIRNCHMEKELLIKLKDNEICAMRHKAELEAKLAECCAEHKAHACEEANKTRELIVKIHEENLRDKLRKTEEELIALKLRATLTPLPVAAVTV